MLLKTISCISNQFEILYIYFKNLLPIKYKYLIINSRLVDITNSYQKLLNKGT